MSDPRVLLVVVDACRADKLGAYGFPRDTSPRLDALAADPDAVRFRRHYAQASWTKPSTASLFTGRFVFEHGVVRGHRRVPGERRFTTSRLSPEFDTLAERLRERGFATFAVSRNPHLRRRYGFDQGFQHYRDASGVEADRRAVRRFLRRARATPGPHFGYLHLHGCHNPFPLDSVDAGYWRRHAARLPRRAGGPDFGVSATREALVAGRLRLAPRDVRRLQLLYEARVRRVDGLLGGLVDGLVAAGVYDDTLLLVTSDHGEELYEHGGYAHGHALHEELIRVPLIAKFPKGHRPAALPRQVEALTNAADLAPSLLSWLTGAEEPGAPALFAGRFRGFALAERGGEAALLQGRDKLVVGETGPRLYDLVRDPGERDDRAPREPGRVAELRGLLADLRRRPGPAVDTTAGFELEPEEVEELRELGYLPGDPPGPGGP